ncbi:MAG: hypothetical protein GX681_01285 [Clostridiaceae bacterium]|nr:hypothetical protein [Clostridiaceae bacterium]
MTNLAVVKLFDPEHIEIPGKLPDWQLTEEELNRHLQELSRQQAEDFDADIVAAADCVICSSPDFSGDRSLYLYPGLDLPGADDARLLIGKKPGDTVRIRLKGQDIELAIERILRRQAHAIDDELIRSLGGPAENLEDYKKEYSQEAALKKKEGLLNNLIQSMIGEMAERSTYNLSASGIRSAAENRLKENLPPGEADLDPQVYEEAINQYISDLKTEAVNRSICQQAGIIFTEENFKQELDSMSDMPDMEEMIDFYLAMLIDGAYADQAAALLRPLAQSHLEDK